MTDMETLMAGMVRPLIWEKHPLGWIAAPPTGQAYIIDVRTKGRVMFVKGMNPPPRFDDLEAAQSAAQADYTARILATLNPDAVLALVAAAYADAADRCDAISKRAWHDAETARGAGCDACWEAVKIGTPPDATAALARLLAEARAEGLEMAAEYCNGDEPGDFWPNLRAGIRAMKGEVE